MSIGFPVQRRLVDFTVAPQTMERPLLSPLPDTLKSTAGIGVQCRSVKSDMRYQPLATARRNCPPTPKRRATWRNPVMIRCDGPTPRQKCGVPPFLWFRSMQRPVGHHHRKCLAEPSAGTRGRRPCASLHYAAQPTRRWPRAICRWDNSSAMRTRDLAQ